MAETWEHFPRVQGWESGRPGSQPRPSLGSEQPQQWAEELEWELARERSLWAVGGLLIKKLGLEAVDSTRYRRLMAQNRMGIGSDFGELCAFAVAIAGVGRVGSETA